MRVALALVAVTAPAFADEPVGSGPPTPAPGSPAPVSPASGPPGQTPPVDPPVDPAYGERPDPRDPRQSAEDDRHVRGVRAGREIVVRYHPDRSRKNITMIAALGGAGVVFGLVGAYFHFDWRDAESSVAADTFTAQEWSQSYQDHYDRAIRSSTLMGVMYGIGGSLLLATAVAYIVTEPAMETRVIHPHTNRKPITMVAPVRGGALVGTGWSF